MSSSEAIETLNIKLANGEITEEEYKRRRELIEGKSTGVNPWFHLWVVLTSVAASLSLFSLFEDFVKVHQFLANITDAWTAIVRPITDFLFSWIFNVFGITLPIWLGDYLVVGAIASFGYLRNYILIFIELGYEKNDRSEPVNITV